MAQYLLLLAAGIALATLASAAWLHDAGLIAVLLLIFLPLIGRVGSRY
ncbi:MAG: hypothetical protein AB7G37_03550 [Solirubrobacteraceae bacterium]